MDFHADPFADLELVDLGSERCNRSHIFVAGRKILVEGQAALDARRRSRMDDLEVGGADRHRVDAHQRFGPPRNRGGLVAQEQFVGAAQNPGLHLRGHRDIGRGLDAGRVVHESRSLFAPIVAEIGARRNSPRFRPGRDKPGHDEFNFTSLFLPRLRG